MYFSMSLIIFLFPLHLRLRCRWVSVGAPQCSAKPGPGLRDVADPVPGSDSGNGGAVVKTKSWLVYIWYSNG